MRKLKVFAEVIYQRFFINWKKYIVIIYTLALTLSSLILIGREAYKNASQFESLSLAKRTYVTRISSPNTIKALDVILKDWEKKVLR